MALVSSFLSICPRIYKSQHQLVADTAWRVRILTLGSLYRQLTIKPQKREIILYRRYAWFFAKRRKLKFERIEAVTYSYSDQSGTQYTSYAYDTFDVFSVGLRVHGEADDIHLFYFYGDGTFTNNGPWPDWLYWEDYLLDMAGEQERESKGFVELLSKMIGVEITTGRY